MKNVSILILHFVEFLSNDLIRNGLGHCELVNHVQIPIQNEKHIKHSF